MRLGPWVTAARLRRMRRGGAELGKESMSSALEGTSLGPRRWPAGSSRAGLELHRERRRGQRFGPLCHTHLLSSTGLTGTQPFSSLGALPVARGAIVQANQHASMRGTPALDVPHSVCSLERPMEAPPLCASDLVTPAWCPLV